MSSKSNNTVTESIESLRSRFEKLQHRKIQVETQLDTEQKRMAELRDEAMKQFGTDDIEKLTEMLKDMEASNSKMLLDYQKSLEAIELDLSRVETEVEKTA